eukprot:sb/3476437/
MLENPKRSWPLGFPPRAQRSGSHLPWHMLQALLLNYRQRRILDRKVIFDCSELRQRSVQTRARHSLQSPRCSVARRRKRGGCSAFQPPAMAVSKRIFILNSIFIIPRSKSCFDFDFF